MSVFDATERMRERIRGTDAASAAGGEWPEADLSAAHQNRRPPPQLPLDVFGPFWSDWIATAAEAASAPPDYVVGPVLAGASTLIGNARWVSPWRGWKEPPILWIGVVGDPSAGKSPGADPVLDILRSIEAVFASDFEAIHREWSTARKSASCLREQWERAVKDATKDGRPPPIMPPNAVEPPEPVRPRIIVADATPEALGLLLAAHDKGLLFFRDELAGWFGGFGRYSGSGADRAFWIEAFGGRCFTIDRVKHPQPIVIPHLSVAVLGGTHPTVWLICCIVRTMDCSLGFYGCGRTQSRRGGRRDAPMPLPRWRRSAGLPSYPSSSARATSGRARSSVLLKMMPPHCSTSGGTTMRPSRSPERSPAPSARRPGICCDWHSCLSTCGGRAVPDMRRRPAGSVATP